MARGQSLVWAILRGSTGGLTYFSNQYHQLVVRARTAPVQPNTALQTAIRSAMSGASIRWKDQLDDTDRHNWDLYAQTVEYQGPVGPYKVPGRQLYIAGRGLADFMLYQGQGGIIVTDAVPSEPGFYVLDNVVSSDPLAPSTGFNIVINNYGTHDIAIIAQCSAPFNVTRNRFKGPWDTAINQYVLGDAETSLVIPFTELNVGMRYFWRVRAVVNDAGHAITTEWFGSHIAATTAP
jgi:hypothetical protein